jgi:hypothetical protein
LKIHHKKIMENETLTHRTRDRARKVNLRRANPINRQRRVIGSLIKTPKSGVSSKTSHGTTPMNVSQNNHWWSSSKKNNLKLT